VAGAENSDGGGAADSLPTGAEIVSSWRTMPRFNTQLVEWEDEEFPEEILLDVKGCGPGGGAGAKNGRTGPGATFRETRTFARVDGGRTR